MVDQYFSPISELEPELELPTTLREAFTQMEIFYFWLPDLVGFRSKENVDAKDILLEMI